MNKRIKKEIENGVDDFVRKTHYKTKIFVCLFCVVGIVVGFIVCHFLSAKDYFKLNGNEVVTLNLNDTYSDAGASALFFGKDISNEIKVQNLEKLDTTKAGTYYITYSLDYLKYREYTLYRKIIVVDNTPVAP